MAIKIEDIIKKPISVETINLSIKESEKTIDELKSRTFELNNVVTRKETFINKLKEPIAFLEKASRKVFDVEKEYNKTGNRNLLSDGQYLEARKEIEALSEFLEKFKILGMDDYIAIKKDYEADKLKLENMSELVQKKEKQKAILEKYLDAFKNNRLKKVEPQPVKTTFTLQEPKSLQEVSSQRVDEEKRTMLVNKVEKPTPQVEKFDYKLLENLSESAKEMNRLVKRIVMVSEINNKLKHSEMNLNNYEKMGEQLRTLNNIYLDYDGVFKKGVSEEVYKKHKEMIASTMDENYSILKRYGLTNRIDLEERLTRSDKEIGNLPKQLEKLEKEFEELHEKFDKQLKFASKEKDNIGK